MNLPGDPVLMMSLLNTYLRDRYSSLEELCEDCELDISNICTKLEAAGFKYQPDFNQFK